MTPLLLAQAALAAPPTVAAAAVADAGRAEAGYYGIGRGGWAVVGPRLWLDPAPMAAGPHLAGLLDADLSLIGGLRPELGAGLGLTLPSPGALHGRVVTTARFDPVTTARAIRLEVGLARISLPEPPPPEPTPPPPADPDRYAFDPSTAMVWVPHPVCLWVPAPEAPPELETLPDGQPFRVTASGYLPGDGVVGLTRRVSLVESPPQGALIVVSDHRDVLRVADQVVQPGSDGVTLLKVPEGAVTIEVAGAGGVEVLEGAVASGYALWLRASLHAPQEILFDVSSAELNAAATAEIGRIAANLGEWRVSVAGSFSEEGDRDANLALADARTRSVVDALRRAGVPAERLELGPAVPPDPTLSMAANRRVVVRPSEEAP